jgi:hypothetical protein
MAAYKDLVGQKITVVTSNPPEPKTGQMWYNSTDRVLRGLGVTSAWRSSAPILVARDAAGSAGTQTTATIFGGNINPGNTSATDEYNGSGFASGGALNTARRQTTGCGLQTAALCVGGYTTANAANVEEYNGTSWSEQNDIPSNSRNGSTFGTQTAALYVGGYTVPVPNSDVIQIYDGTNWTTSPATLGTGGNSISSTGTSTAGLVFGGSNRLNLTEEWNGSAMSAGGNMSTSKYGRGSANQAPSENAMSAGGGIPAQTTVENYDGTSWSTLPSLAVATNDIRGAGTVASAMMMGGGPGAGPVFNTSTEFDQSTNTITAAAWASAPNYPAAGYGGAGCGTSTAGLGFAGRPTAWHTLTCKFDGSSWTTSGALPSGRRYLAGLGTQTAALAAQGAFTPDGPAAATNTSFEFGGSSWTAGNAANTSKSFVTGFGIQTAGTTCGGDTGSAVNTSENYDGTNFSVSGTMNTARANLASAGTQTAGIAYGGNNPPPGSSASETYDGSSWTTGPSLNRGVFALGGTGATNSAALGMGGYTSPPTQITGTELYDGTSWATQPNMATARGYNTVSFGTSTSAVTVGDFPAANTAEIFTGETLTANVTDFSTE